MTRPYNEQLAIARRWDKAVDFASPMSAWTPEMLAEYPSKKQEGETNDPI